MTTFYCIIHNRPGINLNPKTHMSIAQLGDGKGFVAIDAAALTPAAKAELDELTEDGKKLVASMHTHPYHTVAIPAFHAAYPAGPKRRYLGCPRHLKKITKDSTGAAIKWSGDLNDSVVRDTFMPYIEMRVPLGSEFVNPLPANSNHFSNVFVFHAASKTVHVDDTVCYMPKPALLMRALGIKPSKMAFHNSISSVGLYTTAEAPLQFIAWFQQMLDDWDFEHLVCAHDSGCYGVAKQEMQELLDKNTPMLEKLSKRNAAKVKKAMKKGKKTGVLEIKVEPGAESSGWCDDPAQCDCG